jgi:hypothetical protein
MLPEDLERLLRNKALPRKAKLLGILALEYGRPKGQRQIRRIAWHLGLGEVRRWRVGSMLSELAGDVRLGRMGWALTASGAAYVAGLPALLRELEAEESLAAAEPDLGVVVAGGATPPEAASPSPAAAAVRPPPAAVDAEALVSDSDPAASSPTAPATPPQSNVGHATAVSEPVLSAPAIERAPSLRSPTAVVDEAQAPDAAPRSRALKRRPRSPGLRTKAKAPRRPLAAALGGLEALPLAERREAARLLDEIAGALSNGRRTARQVAWGALPPAELAGMRDAFAASFTRDEVQLGLRTVRAVLQHEADAGRLTERALAARLRALAHPVPRRRGRRRSS